MFEMASQLKNFRGLDLDVHRKIANLGEKTFRWEKGTEAHEVKFNYTLNSTATQLLQIFEGLARQQEHVMLLTRRMRYDRLGINDALLQFETDLNHKLLPEPQCALPMLDEIVNDSRFVDIARQRARNLADRIRRRQLIFIVATLLRRPNRLGDRQPRALAANCSKGAWATPRSVKIAAM